MPSEGLDPACLGWALDSKVCNFIDEWSSEVQRDDMFEEL